VLDFYSRPLSGPPKLPGIGYWGLFRRG